MGCEMVRVRWEIVGEKAMEGIRLGILQQRRNAVSRSEIVCARAVQLSRPAYHLVSLQALLVIATAKKRRITKTDPSAP